MVVLSHQRRSVNGVILLDKPPGTSSNQALQIVKRLFNARKAGHGGSLDPLANGLLPLCLGEATKVSGFLLNANKSYRFACQLGVTTSTGDAEGEVLLTRTVNDPDRATIEAALKRFIGEIQQLPPMYSALKHKGQRLYKLARQGIEVERKPRKVTIHQLRLLHMEDERLWCEVHCSKGTYIRSLAEDIGEVLGCGAHIVELRRTGVEPYDSSQMITLEALKARAEQGLAALDSVLLPVDTAIASWPKVRAYEDAAYYLRSGQPVVIPRAPTQGWVRLYEGEEECFMGIGEILDDGRVALRRLIQ